MNVTEDPMVSAFNWTCTDPGPGAVLLGTLMSAVGLVTVAGNLLTVLAFVTDRSLTSKPPVLFILSLSCADLMVGLLMFVRLGQAVCERWPFGEIGCEVMVFFNDVAVGAGMWSMTCIALDRYLLISRDYPRYLKLQSAGRVRLTVGMVWLNALGCSLVELVVWEVADLDEVSTVDFDVDCLPPPRFHQAFALVSMSVYLLSIGAMIGLSLLFLALLRRRLRKGFTGASPKAGKAGRAGGAASQPTPNGQVRLCAVSQSMPTKGMSTDDESLGASSDAPPSGGDSSAPVRPPAASESSSAVVGESRPSGASADSGRDQTGTQQRQKRAATTHDRYVRPAIIMGTLVTAFLLFTLPYIFFFGVVCFCPACYHHAAEFHLVNLFYLNSCVNPFLYAAIHPKIRRCQLGLLRSLAQCLTCRRARQAHSANQGLSTGKKH